MNFEIWNMVLDVLIIDVLIEGATFVEMRDSNLFCFESDMDMDKLKHAETIAQWAEQLDFNNRKVRMESPTFTSFCGLVTSSLRSPLLRMKVFLYGRYMASNKYT